jgi:hypothetical protein
MTRGQIAYLADSNTIFSIYIHYASDSNLDEILPEYFNSDSEAEDLVMNGNDIRFIDSETGEVERYDKGGAVQITDDEPADLFSELYDHVNKNSADVVYVWLEDKWITLDGGMLKDRRSFVGALLDQIRNNEPTMENKDKMKEGYYSTTNVENHIQTLGYDSFEDFFSDNPGGEEALISWIESVPEFRKMLMQQGLMEAKKDKEEMDEAFVRQMKYKAGIIK